MTPKISDEEFEQRLRLEFVDDAHDRLQRIYDAVERSVTGQCPDTEMITLLRMEVHSFKGSGTAFGYPVITLVAHRMEDYIGGLSHFSGRQIEDIHTFLDLFAKLVDRKDQPQLAETNQILRALPVRYVFDIKDVEVRNVEIMVVTPSKVVAKKVGTELAACGFRAITVQDPIESIGLAVRVPPDMLIASMVMDGLSGIDLIRGLLAMSATQKVKMALLTSLDLDNPKLREVPTGVGMIRLGPKFSEDIATIITRFNLG
ncbi:MAG: Hpt domain-containing protein [Rhodospirillaceae bacterium]